MALALVVVAPSLVGATETPAPDPAWHGAAGFLIPLEEYTPVELHTVRTKLVAMLPPRKVLDAPRVPDQWEVSTVYKLINRGERPVTLTLVQPEVPREPQSTAPDTERVVFSLDGKRYPLADLPAPVAGPTLPGVPPFRYVRKLEIELGPGEKRRVDTLFRIRGVATDGAVRLRFIEAGAGRFAGGKAGRMRYEIGFGQRVHLVEEGGQRAPLVESPPAGLTTDFFDDGDNSRLVIAGRDYRPGATIELAFVGEGISPPAGEPGTGLLGKMKPLEDLTTNELKLAAMTLTALHGRWLRDPMGRQVFEELPWSDCNPAYWVAHGRTLDPGRIKEFIEEHSCEVSCIDVRATPVPPYGSRWTTPRCWYSPVRNRSQTLVRDPKIKAKLDGIDEELAVRFARKKARAEAVPVKPGCGCQQVGRGEPLVAAAPIGLLLLGLALRRVRSFTRRG